jgi:hypothetical protein
LIHQSTEDVKSQEGSASFSRRDLLYLVLVALLCVAACLPLLTKHPAPGGDEAAFVDPAVNLATRGVLGTEIFQGIVPGIEQHIYFHQPFYYVALAGWFRLFGIGLVQARAFSLLFAVVIVVFVYLLSRRWATAKQAFIVAALCAVSFWLINRASFARMDTLCVALILASVFVYMRATEKAKVSLYGISGLLAGVAFVTHPLGLIAIGALSSHLLLSRKWAALKSPEMYAMLGGFGVSAAIWVVYILQDFESFRAQMHASLIRKRLQLGPYWRQFWLAKTHVITLLVALSAGMWLVWKWRRVAEGGILALAFLFAFAAATIGREAGYFLYFYPFACIALAILLNRAHKQKPLLYAALALVFANEFAILANDIRRYHHRDYAAVTNTMLTVIPPGKSVFIETATLSPYFALVGRNPMRASFPAPLPDPNVHSKVAQACDFIVISVPVGYLPDVAALVNDKKPLVEVNQGLGYRTSVFERSTYAASHTAQR